MLINQKLFRYTRIKLALPARRVIQANHLNAHDASNLSPADSLAVH
jgi:hypothetical protein